MTVHRDVQKTNYERTRGAIRISEDTGWGRVLR